MGDDVEKQFGVPIPREVSRYCTKCKASPGHKCTRPFDKEQDDHAYEPGERRPRLVPMDEPHPERDPDRVWTQADAMVERPWVAVKVEGHPRARWGRVATEGNNPWVIVDSYDGKCLASRRYSWGLVLQVLNDRRGMRLDVGAGHERAPAAPEPGEGFFKE